LNIFKNKKAVNKLLATRDPVPSLSISKMVLCLLPSTVLDLSKRRSLNAVLDSLGYTPYLPAASAIPSGITIPGPNNLDIGLATSYKGSKTLIPDASPSSLTSAIPNSYAYLS
jgi:hypothetical protein